MKGHDGRPRAAWRGSAVHAVQEEDLTAELATDRPGRVAVLMGHAGNRAHAIRQLEGHCTLVEPKGSHLAPGSFDLAITDVAGLKAWWTLLLDAKFQAEPTFLPVVLILSRSDLRHRVRSFWDVIDEFVTSPVEPQEFTERVSMLLRTRKLALAQRNHLAYVVNHDRITGLPNKNLFMARIQDAIRDASVLGGHAHVTVLHVPLARVLKSFGNQGMDALAAKFSSRLSALVGEEVSLARLTTEEWGLVHRPGVKLPELLGLLRRARSVADAPFEIGGEAVRLAPRLGVGVYPLDATDAASLLDRALAALATTTSAEPVFYSREVQDAALRSIRTESRLHDALAEEQFELWYQPLIDMRSGRVIGVEALVRWRLPNGELVPPGQFLPVAEETGLICEIDGWVLREACRAMRRWTDDGLGIERISVNIGVQDVNADDFVASVRLGLREARLQPSCLELELTETELVETTALNMKKLDALREDGVRIAVDDFGTGYSSLAYLRSLPVTTLKIDRTFVTDITNNKKHADITEAIVWLARRFGLDTVAEGIETREEAVHLSSLGIDVAQGFLYARPMPDHDLRDWLKGWDARGAMPPNDSS